MFEKVSEKKIHTNPSNGSRVVSSWTVRQLDGQADMIKLIVVFLNVVTASKNL